MISSRSLIVPILLLGISLSPRLEARAKSDVLVMKNGDRITCEIKKLEKGQLLIKTDYTTGTIALDWGQVDQIESSELFQVELTDGERHDGTLAQASSGEKLRVVRDSDTLTFDPPEVVGIEQLGRNYLQQLDGGLDLGFSSTSSNSQTQLTASAEVQRRSRKDLWSVRGSSILSRQSDGADTNRHNVNANYQRFLSRSWLAGSYVDFLQSDEQQLDLRTTLGGFGGRHFVRSNRTDLLAFGGIVLNREKFFALEGGQPTENNVEAVVGTRVLLFRFDSTQFDSTFQLYPSLTQAGRFRIDFSTNMYLDLWGDLYFRLTFFDNYDSRPPVDAPGNDLGITTSIGYSF